MDLKFLFNYADEALAIGKALTGLLDGVAINGNQAKDITDAIARLEKAHASISAYIASAPKQNVVKISAKDIDAAVERYMAKKAK